MYFLNGNGPVNLIFKLLIGLLASVFGAVAAQYLRIPLPWMLGPLIAVGICRISAVPVVASAPLRNAGQWVIGMMLGLYFTPAVGGIISSQWLAMVAGLFLALLFGVYGTFLLYRFGGVNVKTAWFSSAIGGANDMVNLSERYGAMPELVASAHILRITLVVLIVPFACQLFNVSGSEVTLLEQRDIKVSGLLILGLLSGMGGYVLHKLRIPNAWVLGPMFVAMVFTLLNIHLSSIPIELSKVAQLFIGWSLGDRFRPGFFKKSPKFLFIVLVFTLTSLVFAFGFAELLAIISGLPLGSLAVSVAPGGIAEMAITAKVLQLGVPLVTAFQVSRMVGVVLLTAPIYIHVVSRYWPDNDLTVEKN